MVLFIIKDSVVEGNAWMLKYAASGDIILLIQDGVLALNSRDSDFTKKASGLGVEVFALGEDATARGVENRIGAKLVDYQGFLELIEKNKVFS